MFVPGVALNPLTSSDTETAKGDAKSATVHTQPAAANEATTGASAGGVDAPSSERGEVRSTASGESAKRELRGHRRCPSATSTCIRSGKSAGSASSSSAAAFVSK